MSGFISQSFPSNFLAGLRSLFNNSPLNGSRTTPEANQASAQNPSPATPKSLNLLEKFKNLFAFFKPTKTVPVAPQALGSNARANTSTPLTQLQKAMGELGDLRGKRDENDKALQAAKASLEELEDFKPSQREQFNFLVGAKAIDQFGNFGSLKEEAIKELQTTINQCTARQTELSQKITQLSKLVVELRDALRTNQ